MPSYPTRKRRAIWPCSCASVPPVYSGLSVEFHPLREHRDGGQRVIDDAELRGAGLTDTPAYPDTRVEVRSEPSRPPLRGIWRWL